MKPDHIPLASYAERKYTASALKKPRALARPGCPASGDSRPPNYIMFSRIPFDRVNWPTSSFLIGTLFLSLTAVPAYIWFFWIDWFQIGLFFVMFCACGFSITLGYHRLFSHLTFQARWIVRLLTLIFGAGAFEQWIRQFPSRCSFHDCADDFPVYAGLPHLGNWPLRSGRLADHPAAHSQFGNPL